MHIVRPGLGARDSRRMHPDEFFDRFLYDSGPPDTRTAGRNTPGPVATWELWWRIRARVLAEEHPGFAPALRQGLVLRTDQVTGSIAPTVRRNMRSGAWCAPQPRTRTVVNPTTGDDSDDPFVVARRRHALACAAAAAVNPGFVVSGCSAAILHGLPTVAVPDRPQLSASPRLNAHRRGKAGITRGEVVRWFGVPVTSPARTVVDVARADRREGIVVADAALRENLADEDGLTRALERAGGWCGVRAARGIVALADGRAESPLESLTRLALHDDGFPAPSCRSSSRSPGCACPTASTCTGPTTA